MSVDLAAIAGSARLLRPSDAGFAALAARFAVHPGVEATYIGAVCPANAEEVRHAVGAAHAAGLGLLTVFSASNTGARLTGSGEVLILDLSVMTGILETSVANGYVRIEPGVTYAQLSAHFAANDLPLWVDSERDPLASVVGSTLAKGTGFTPYADHALVQCGAEFALPYGELMRTGMGAMPGSHTWQVYKYALGPYADGLALQSGLMVPTQMGVWVMGQVPAMEVLAYDIAGDDELAQALEVLRGLKIAGLLPATVSMMPQVLEVARFGTTGGPAWRLLTPLYGVPRVVALARAAVGAALGSVPGVTAGDPEASRAGGELADMMAGKPGHGALQLGDGAHATLTFVAPIEDRHGSAMIAAAGAALASMGQPPLMEFAIVGRALMQTVYLPYSPADAASVATMADAAIALAGRMALEGIGVAAQSFELAHLGLGQAAEGGLAVLHDRIAEALTA